MTNMSSFFVFVWALILSVALAATCDDYAYPAESTKATKLTPNTFHKICPSESSLGTPICGDGTPFSFYYTSPVKRRTTNKILIEFLGGGACWDANTCANNADLLTFPYRFDDFLGLSCSEIQAGMTMNQDDGDQDLPINMLCAEKVGDVDFREYHTIIVPYCTQDTHMGSNLVNYDGTVVQHQGASNMLSVLEWVYANFPHPDQVVLTGCSAGGTVLPLAYDLVYHHYNSFVKGKSTAFSTLTDSPVYLTPSYFLEQGLPNWNVEPLMKLIRFNYKKYSESENFSSKLIEHVMRRSSRKNKLGLITHNSDPVSLAYFQRMSAADDDGDERRHLEDNQDISEEEWWQQLSTSVNSVTKKFRNADSFIIEGEGHCSFGLYYALQEGGDNFQTWAGNLLKMPSKRPSGQGWFWISALVGCGLVGATFWHQRRVETQEAGIDPHELLVLQQKSSLKGSMIAALQRAAAFVAFYTKDAPVTIAYGVAVTIYFVRLMTWDTFELFFYNPSLGPTAATLSSFGINNPTLVVYHRQIMRALITSTFLCSGIVTYCMVIYSLFFYIQKVEKAMRSMSQPNETDVKAKTLQFRFASTYFLQVAALISIGSNLLYAILTSGGSCSSMALVLGLQTFSCTVHRHHGQVDFPCPRFATVFMFLITCCFLPYNSWIMMICAVGLGFLLAVRVFWFYSPKTLTVPKADPPAPVADDSYSRTEEDYTEESITDFTSYAEEEIDALENSPSVRPSGVTLLRRNRPLQVLLALFVVLLVCLLVKIRRPNRMYEQPFLTGCDLVYTTHVDEIARSYVGDQFVAEQGEAEEQEDDDNDRRQRRLEDADEAEEERDEEHMCAQFCVPHLVSRPLLWGANIYTGFDVQSGVCENVGYSQHIADKTFSYKGYSFDVELYFDDGYSGYDNGDGSGDAE